MNLRGITVLLGALCAFPAVAAAPPQERGYPERPVRFVIPPAPGGATDIVTRMLGPRLSERIGQQVVSDNRAGAAGNIAVEIVSTAQPDGYTVLVGNIPTDSIDPILLSVPSGPARSGLLPSRPPLGLPSCPRCPLSPSPVFPDVAA